MIIAIGCAAGRIMSTLGLPFAAINTDWRELEHCAADRKLPISQHGLSAGANPIIGAQAAEEAAEAIAALCMEPVPLAAAQARVPLPLWPGSPKRKAARSPPW